MSAAGNSLKGSVIILDLLILILLAWAGHYGYKHGPSKALYDFFKIIAGLSLASYYSGSVGLFLTRKGLLAPDNWAVLLLIGFMLLFLLYWVGLMLVERYWGATIKSRSGKLYYILGAVVSFVEAFVIASLLLFILSQFKAVKLSAAYDYMHDSSVIYPVMARLCRTIITDGLVDSIVSGNGTSSKEILYNTLTNEDTLKVFIP